MEFEQKYQIISNLSKRDLLDSILMNVFENLRCNQKTTIRMLEDVICLDLMTNVYSGSMESWKRRNRFKVPVMVYVLELE